MKYLYYCFGGGLGHITRFNAFCNTLSIEPILLTALKDVTEGQIKTFAQDVILLPKECYTNKNNLKKWVGDCINEVKPDKFIIDAFPCGILGELTDLYEFDNIKIEYIARILKLDEYLKRIDGTFPKFSKIWQVEDLDEKQNKWLNMLAIKNNIEIDKLKLIYPNNEKYRKISLPKNFWLIVHSGSEDEVRDLYEYARDIATLENLEPNFVVIGQITRPNFLPNNIPYYSFYPVTNLLKKADRVFSGAGFNIMHQMEEMKEKHVVLPFNRPLDDQYIRVKLMRGK